MYTSLVEWLPRRPVTAEFMGSSPIRGDDIYPHRLMVGRRPFKAEIRIRLPLGVMHIMLISCFLIDKIKYCLFNNLSIRRIM